VISAENSFGPSDLLAYEEIEPLIAAFDDPEEAVRIAVLRALLRLRAYLDSQTIKEIRLRAERELQHLVELYFITYLPSDEVRSRLLRDLQWSQQAVNEHPSPKDYWDYYEDPLRPANDTQIITEHFAALASERYPYNHRSHIREGAGDIIAQWVWDLRDKFTPDIPALFDVYVALIERASNQKREFLAQMWHQEHLDITRTWPSWWSWGPVTVSWQIAWTASRACLPLSERLVP